MFSLDYASNSTRTYTPVIQVYDASVEGDIATLGNGKTGVSQAKETEMKVQSDYLLTYTNSWGDHSVTATAGFTTYYNKLENLTAPVPRGRPGHSGQSRQMVRKYRRRSHRHQRQYAVGALHRVRAGTRALQLQGQVPVQRLLPPRRFFRLLLHRQPVAELLLRRPGLADERGSMDEGHHLAGYAETESSWGTLATRTWTAPIPPNRC